MFTVDAPEYVELLFCRRESDLRTFSCLERPFSALEQSSNVNVMQLMRFDAEGLDVFASLNLLPVYFFVRDRFNLEVKCEVT
jgi:hypothetical protein